MNKYRSLRETDHDRYNGNVTVENIHQPRAAKKHSSSKDKVRPWAFVRCLFFNSFLTKVSSTSKSREYSVINSHVPIFLAS